MDNHSLIGANRSYGRKARFRRNFANLLVPPGPKMDLIRAKISNLRKSLASKLLTGKELS